MTAGRAEVGQTIVFRRLSTRRTLVRLLNTMVATLIMTMPVYRAVAQAPALKPWSAAVYRGLVAGTSTREDVLKLLGKPAWSGGEPDTGTPIITYTVSDPVPGSLIVYITNGILDGVRLLPIKPLTRSEISRLFGPGYVVVHYAIDECLAEGGTAPTYEAPDGPITQLEYRDRGIVADLQNSEVTSIAFVSRSVVPTKSVCAERNKKKK